MAICAGAAVPAAHPAGPPLLSAAPRARPRPLPPARPPWGDAVAAGLLAASEPRPAPRRHPGRRHPGRLFSSAAAGEAPPERPRPHFPHASSGRRSPPGPAGEGGGEAGSRGAAPPWQPPARPPARPAAGGRREAVANLPPAGTASRGPRGEGPRPGRARCPAGGGPGGAAAVPQRPRSAPELRAYRGVGPGVSATQVRRGAEWLRDGSGGEMAARW